MCVLGTDSTSKVTIRFIDKIESRVATIVIRGSTEGLMDDVERLMEDGVNTFKALTRDGRLLPGGGATETELANTLMKYGEVSINSWHYLYGCLSFSFCLSLSGMLSF